MVGSEWVCPAAIAGPVPGPILVLRPRPVLSSPGRWSACRRRWLSRFPAGRSGHAVSHDDNLRPVFDLPVSLPQLELCHQLHHLVIVQE